MSRDKIILILFVSLCAPRAALSADKKDKVKPQDLLARARSEEILRTKGTPPFVMRAELQAANGKGGWVNGEYDLFWASPSQWREEVKLGSYYRTRVGTEQGYWQVSNLEYQPEAAFELDGLLNLNGTLRNGNNERLSKVHVRRTGALSEYCVGLSGKFGRSSTLCFDGSTDDLLSVEYPAHPEVSRIEYSSFKTVYGKSVPFEIQGFHGRNPSLVMTITKIENMPEHDAGLFEQPAASEFWATCDEVTVADLKHMVFPDSPRPVEFTKSVTLYLVVEPNGLPSHITVIQGSDSGLERAAIAAARQWRYKPAMCGDTPVRAEIETTLTVGP